jgi:hypothetical protein
VHAKDDTSGGTTRVGSGFAGWLGHGGLLGWCGGKPSRLSGEKWATVGGFVLRMGKFILSLFYPLCFLFLISKLNQNKL